MLRNRIAQILPAIFIVVPMSAFAADATSLTVPELANRATDSSTAQPDGIVTKKINVPFGKTDSILLNDARAIRISATCESSASVAIFEGYELGLCSDRPSRGGEDTPSTDRNTVNLYRPAGVNSITVKNAAAR